MHRALVLFLLSLSACPSTDTPDDDDSAVADDDDSVAGDDDDATPPPDLVTVTTADGLDLSAAWQPPTGTDPGPAVLLLHQYAHDHHDFDLVLDGFAAAGIGTLALDLRSHGESDMATVAFGELPTDPTQFPEDAQAGVAWLAAQPEVDPARVGVMGLSVGANLAVVANQNRAAWGVATTVVLSADLAGIQALAGTTALDLQSSLYIAGDQDQPPADDADALGALTAEPVDVRRVLGTSAHGVNLITASPDVREGVVAWFVDQL